MPYVTDLPAYKPHRLRVMFKCTACKAVCPVNAVEVRFAVEQHGPRAMGYTRTTRFYVLVDAPLSWEPDCRSIEATNRNGVAANYLHMTRCGACGAKHGERTATGRIATIKQDIMHCKHNPDHKCDPRCTGAKGHDCECSCGGANHGSDHRGAFA